jgi:hypothetical protein
MPAWLVSFILHVVLLLILAVIPLAQLTKGPLTLFWGNSASVGLAEFELSGAETPVAAEALESELTSLQSQTDLTEMLEMELPDLTTSLPETGQGEPAMLLDDLPFGLAQGLTGRSGAMKQALLSKFGGNAATEEAVELGLLWLSKQQKSNGSWSLVGPYSDGGAAENATAATALALNAFLGAGYTHQTGKYKENVKLGLSFLVKRQDPEGYFPDPREPSRQQMYAQAIASITVAEAYGMTQDSSLRVPAERAMRFAQWSQSNLRGWRYFPREDADLSVTGWFLMALQTGRMAGLAVDEKVVNSVSEFLDSVSYEEDSRYAYDDFEPPTLSMTAEGLLCRIYLGWPRSHPALLRAIEDDLIPNAPDERDREYSVYYWYYATQVMHHVGGAPWEKWNAGMRRVLPALQEKSGVEAGSWDPSRDAFSASGGRLYTTCLNLYCLEVYYRHLALYDIP